MGSGDSGGKLHKLGVFSSVV